VTPTTPRTELPVLILAGLSLGAVVGLTAAHIAVPVALWAAFSAFTGGGLGLTVPSSSTTSTETTLRSAVTTVESALRALGTDASQIVHQAPSSAPVAPTAPAAPVTPTVPLAAVPAPPIASVGTVGS
jgi:hypothetical protein